MGSNKDTGEHRGTGGTEGTEGSSGAGIVGTVRGAYYPLSILYPWIVV